MAGLRRPTAGWHGASKARCSKHNSIMKNFRQILSISLATGARLITSLLYEMEPLNPFVFGGVTVLFAVVAGFACLLPSLRASRIDPLVALRTD